MNKKKKIVLLGGGYGGPVEPDVRLESKYLKDAVNDLWDKL